MAGRNTRNEDHVKAFQYRTTKLRGKTFSGRQPHVGSDENFPAV